MTPLPAVAGRRAASLSRRACGLAAIVLLSTRCDDFLVAPDGSTIDLTVAAPTIAADGGTTTVSALVVEKDGYFAEDGTTVVFMVSGGELCDLPKSGAAPADCDWSSILATKTGGGVARAIVRAGPAGTLTLDARSGGTKGTPKPITVSALAAPLDGKVVLQPREDTVTVGSVTRIRAFISDAKGAPVPDATRVVFTTTMGRLSRSIVLTQSGFAESNLAAGDAGRAVVQLVSGGVRDSTVLVVRKPS